jgi:hypothetical protein
VAPSAALIVGTHDVQDYLTRMPYAETALRRNVMGRSVGECSPFRSFAVVELSVIMSRMALGASETAKKTKRKVCGGSKGFH